MRKLTPVWFDGNGEWSVIDNNHCIRFLNDDQLTDLMADSKEWHHDWYDMVKSLNLGEIINDVVDRGWKI